MSKLSIRSLVAIGAVGSALVTSVNTAQANPLNTYNLLVFRTYSSSSSVEGRTAVGGNFTTNASDFGTRLLPAGQFTTTDTLIVGGNINGGNINLQAGDLRRGGTRTGNLNLNGGGSSVQQDRQDAGTAAFVTGLANQARAISTSLSGLMATNTVNIPQNQPGPVVLNAIANSQGVAVFNVDGVALLANSRVQSIDLNFNNASSVVINVTGSFIDVNSGNLVGNLANAANANRIIWNFADADFINVNRNWTGAILAPDATLTNTTVITGSVAVMDFAQKGQVHLPLYTGFVPSPNAAAALGLGALVAARRRRAK
jgi:choice-of-anchor A domain-containing protein